jgi:hypothetical protein
MRSGSVLRARTLRRLRPPHQLRHVMSFKCRLAAAIACYAPHARSRHCDFGCLFGGVMLVLEVPFFFVDFFFGAGSAEGV